MVPPFDDRGLLPVGIHACDGWGEFSKCFATNAHRVKLMRSLQKFIDDELTNAANGLRLIVGGSYLTDKPDPGDIDCTIMLPFEQIPKRGLLLQLGFEGGKGRIWNQYNVEMFLTVDRPPCNNLAIFFQYVGEKTAAAKNLKTDDLRGVIELNSWTLG